MNTVEAVTLLVVVAVVVEAIAVLCAVHAAIYARTSQGAIAWAISLVTFPWLTLPLYGLFGASRFHGYVASRRKGDAPIQQLAAHLAATQLPEVRSEAATQHDALKALEQLAKMPFVNFNRSRLLIDGPATFDAIFKAINEAKDYVLVQFFIVKDDRIGQQLRDTLIAAATRGVAVYFLYDAVGSHRLSSRYLQPLHTAGVAVARFAGKRSLLRHLQVNFRNHRKIVVVDGHSAYVGGHNVGDEYLGHHPRLTPWRDTHVEVTGPAALAVQLTFLEDWHAMTQAIPPLCWTPFRAHEPGDPVLVLPSGPADAVDTCGLFFVHAIHAAKHRLWIASPYFVPDDAVLSALRLAAMRGVDVRIMLPGKPDHLIVHLAGLAVIGDAYRSGIRFFRYRDGFMHQKVMVVDDIAAVGTANLDNRSFRLNFEVMLIFWQSAFCQTVLDMLRHDFTRCDEVTETDHRRRPLHMRAAASVARLFAPVL